MRQLVLPVTAPMRALAHSALVTSLDDAVKKEKGLEPLVLQLKPFPFLWLLALDLFESMVKSADGSVLLKIFSSDAEVNPSHTLTSTTPARPAPQPPPYYLYYNTISHKIHQISKSRSNTRKSIIASPRLKKIGLLI